MIDVLKEQRSFPHTQQASQAQRRKIITFAWHIKYKALVATTTQAHQAYQVTCHILDFWHVYIHFEICILSPVKTRVPSVKQSPWPVRVRRPLFFRRQRKPISSRQTRSVTAEQYNFKVFHLYNNVLLWSFDFHGFLGFRRQRIFGGRDCPDTSIRGRSHGGQCLVFNTPSVISRWPVLWKNRFFCAGFSLICSTFHIVPFFCILIR